MAAAPVQAADLLLICDVGGPGDALQAQAQLDRFLRFAEKEAGLEAGRLTGQYHTDARDCREAAEKTPPALVALDVVTWLQQRTAWKLDAIGHFGGPEARRLHLLARPGGPSDRAALKGQTIATTLDDAAFVDRVALGGALGDGGVTLATVKRPLKAVRQAAKGEVAAALVDDAARTAAGEIGLDPAPVTIFTSEGLPGLTVGAVPGVDAALVAALQKAMPRLCGGDGAELCALMGVHTARAADAAGLDALQKRYAAP